MSTTDTSLTIETYSPQHPIRFLLAALIALGPFTMSLYTPSMPAIREAMATSESLVQASITVFLAAVALGQLFYGPVSDRYGRRGVLFFGYALFILASIGCALATDISHLLIARVFQGLGASASAVMSRAIIRDLFDKSDIARMLSFVSMALAVAPAVGPLLGGQLETAFGWQSNFVVLAAGGSLLMLLVYVVLPETNRNVQKQSFLRSYGTLLGSRQFLGYAGPVGAVLGGIFSFHSVAPFILIDLLEVPPTRYGFFTLMSVSGYFFGAFISNRAAGRVPGDRLIVTGLVLAALGGSGLLVLGWLESIEYLTLSPLLFMTPFILWAFSAGLVMPNGATGALQPFPRIAGAASALLGAIQIGSGAAMSLAIGAIGGFLPLTFGLATTALVVIGGGLYLWGVACNPACDSFMQHLEPRDDQPPVSTIE